MQKRFAQYLLLTLTLGLFPLVTFAFLDEPPPYKVQPILHGLNVNHFVKQDRIKLKLYLQNNENYPILCDAQYKGGPDKRNVREQIIEAKKVGIFKFSYGRAVDDVFVTYMCVDPEKYERNDKYDSDNEEENEELL